MFKLFVFFALVACAFAAPVLVAAPGVVAAPYAYAAHPVAYAAPAAITTAIAANNPLSYTAQYASGVVVV